MNNRYQTALLLFIAVFLFVDKALAQSKTAMIKTYLNEAHQSGLFNGNILISDHGKIIVREAIGFADASKEIPLTTAYRFHIGSIAKEFDAVGIMMLQEQGKLNIADKISKFFPELPQWAQQISIKNLLQYTSGLSEVKYKTVHNDNENWDNLKAVQQLDFIPGSSYAYNNNNTFLRRRIIERITGVPFTQFVHEQILKKIGIKNGVLDPTINDKLVAKSFNNDFKQDGLEVPISGWTCLNINDFYKWSQCIWKFCLISPSSTREIITPVNPGKQCGLGGGIMEGNKVIKHIHDGTALHYQALLSTDVEKGRTIILLTNQKQGNLYEIEAAIHAILDNKPFKTLAKTASN